MLKKFGAFVIVLVLLFSFIPTSFALPADDIVTVASKEVGVTNGSKYGSGAWCAHFVVWCAKQSGIASSVIPYTGACTTMYSTMLKSCGAKVVSTPQRGDLVFYKSKTSANVYVHVGIMIDGKASIQGNLNSKVMKISSALNYIYANGTRCTQSDLVYVRPNYTVPVTSIKLSSSSLTLKAGQRTALTATISPTNATCKDVTWTSSNTNVVYVNFLGVLYTQKKGTATITVTSSNGIKATCKVTVK